MVTNTVDSSSNPNTTDAPNFPRKNLTSPWAQVVRGADSESLNNRSPSPQSNSSSSLDSGNSDVAIAAAAAVVVDNSNADKNNNAGNPKKPAWKNTSTGDVAEVSPLMDVISWPALSGKPSPKMPSHSSSIEGLNFIPQGPVILNASQKQATGTANAKLTPPTNNNVASRHRPMKRGGGNNNSNESGPLRNSFPNHPQANHQPSSASLFWVGQNPPNNTFAGVQSYRNNNGWGPRSPSVGHGMQLGEQRNPSHRGNGYHYGSRPNSNYGIRRNQHVLSTSEPQTFQHVVYSPGFIRHVPLVSASFSAPFEQFGPVQYFTQLPPPPPPPTFIPAAANPLHHFILKQIDYYFSDTNLAKDDFLRFNMDEQGWVLISVIAKFPRISSMTRNIDLILDSLRNSSVVEVQGDKLRRRNDWIRWLPSAQQLAGYGSVSPTGSSCNNIATDFNKITLNNTIVDSTGESSC